MTVMEGGGEVWGGGDPWGGVWASPPQKMLLDVKLARTIAR